MFVCVEEEEEGLRTFKFCDICSLQLECVYFYTASHKQRARLAPLVNVPARYDGKANEILTGRQKEWGEERGQRERKRKNDKITCDKNAYTQCLHSRTQSPRSDLIKERDRINSS